MIRAYTIHCLLAASMCGKFSDAGSLRSSLPVAGVSQDEVETSLASELSGNISNARLLEIEEQLRPTVLALPKGPNGQLSHEAVRYVLHRLFVHRHRWYMRGLEPGAVEKDWVPAHLQSKLEERFGGDGIHLHEVAALAAALEDLIHKEAADHLKEVYSLHGFSTEGLRTPGEVREAIGTYMMLYLKNAGSYGFRQHAFTFGVEADNIETEKEKFKTSYIQWSEVEDWFGAIVTRRVEAAEGSGLDFDSVSSLLAEVSENFGFFNDRDCRELKSTLLDMQVGQTGRVRLSEFYGKSLQTHWAFNERVDYLRSVGVLDEITDTSEPRLLLANYISSRSNCIESSMLYSVCCRNECEDLIGKLEVEIGAPTAETQTIASFVEGLPSPTVTAPRHLSPLMLRRLDEIANANGGRVPIHGRLFAQWMHHAYPRECPYPHEAGVLNPRAPYEWMKESGQADAGASDDKLKAELLKRWMDREQQQKDTAHEGTEGVVHRVVTASGAVEEERETAELHWSDVEETFCGLADAPAASSQGGSPAKDFEIASSTPESTHRFLPYLFAQIGRHPTAVLLLGIIVIGGLSCLTYVAARAEIRGEGLSLPNGQAWSNKPGLTLAQRRGLLLVSGALTVVGFVLAADAAGLLDRHAFVGAIGLVGVAVVGSVTAKRFRAGAALKAKIKGCENCDHWA